MVVADNPFRDPDPLIAKVRWVEPVGGAETVPRTDSEPPL